MSDEQWKVQASYKHGDLQQHMLNVRGENAADLKTQLSDLSTYDVLGDVVSTGLTLGALTSVVPLAQQEQAAPAPVPPAPSADPWATATPAPPPAPASATPSCVHGPRQYKSGAGAKGPWQGWMCPAQRNDPTKCEPQWIR